jgi:Cu-Zn family superoxide dismutase
MAGAGQQPPCPLSLRIQRLEIAMKKPIQLLVGAAAMITCVTGVAFAQQLTVDINKTSDAGVGDKIGTITIAEGKKGTTFKVAVTGLPAGNHGFHVHDKGDCAAAMKDGKMEPGFAAGSHYDPSGTKTHKGPQGAGHKGDLPVLTSGAKGINQTVTAPHLKLADVLGRALMIHDGGDNYSDSPENGGGKGRIACGVVPKT